MKLSPTRFSNPSLGLWTVCLAILFLLAGCKKWHEPPVVHVTTVATGLNNPMGIDADPFGNIWVSEGETIQNDGSVWMIRPNGKKYQAVVNLAAFPNAQSGEPQGTSHLLYDRGYLWVLSGDYLYRINVAGFKPGDAPVNAEKLAKEDIGAFVYGQGFNDSHAYNLTKGPNGDLYIADAGANIIIHRRSAGKYAVLANIPGYDNPNPAGPPPGPPVVQSVPTSVWFDGRDLLVTTLTGFPFLSGKASIFKVSAGGNVSLYQSGFTTLVDMAPGINGNHVVVHYGDFGPAGFVAGSGALLWADGSSIVPFVKDLALPVGIKQTNDHSWLVTCTGDPAMKGAGSVIRVTYE